MVAIVKYSIVVPVYGSAAWLGELVSRIGATMCDIGDPFELILVNDAAPDSTTWPTIVELAEKHEWLHGIDLLYNTGQFRATCCGLEHARGIYVITMDDDLQHPPEELPKLTQAMNEYPEMDCVMGEYASKQHSVVRNVGSRFFRAIMNRLYDKPPNMVTTSFRIMTADLVRTLVLCRMASPQLGPLIVRLTKNTMNVPVEHHPRIRGRSGYSLIHCARELLQSVVNASILPLRWFSVMGSATAGLAFMLAGWYFVRWLRGGITVAGYTSMILAISFFSGMILAGIGVLGEYIGRIIQEVTGLPRYTVRQITKRSDDSGN